MNTTDIITEIVCENLGLEAETVDKEASFFEIGGNSLTAYIVIEDIAERLRVELKTEELMEHNSISYISALVEEKLKTVRISDSHV